MRRLYKLPKLREREPVEIMIANYEKLLNPNSFKLSNAARKRLKWMYVVTYETGGNIRLAAGKLGITRQWLSVIHGQWIKAGRDPRSLEPANRAPLHTFNRIRIASQTVEKIIELRKQYPTWGKEKIAKKLETKHQITVCPTTINNYLGKFRLLNVRLSEKNKLAYRNKTIKQQQRVRPPKVIKDYQPGALIEKDMKFVLKMGKFSNSAVPKARENFWYQHTEIDSFTRIRTLELAESAESSAAMTAHKLARKRFPFPVASINTDSGGENGGQFAQTLTDEQVIQFFSRIGTPTDNPRVERSHLTDEIEFYQQGSICRTLPQQRQALKAWEKTYNYERPHQALGYLTPMEFYHLWKQSPKEACRIKDRYQAYLRRQSKRLAVARRMKKREQIKALMQHIDQTLNSQKIAINQRQLCSLA